MSTEHQDVSHLIEALPEAQRREVLDFARSLLRKKRGRTNSFRHVPDPMSPADANEFSRIIEDAFEQVDIDE
jgi:hypothetical protein